MSMHEMRLGGIFYDNRGPLVFSASVHFVILVVAAIFVMINPSKKPEELVFILEAPPPGGYSQPQDVPTLDELDYRSEDVPMPTEDDIPKPVIKKLPTLPPEPVAQERPVETIEVKEKEPEPEKMSLEEFQKRFGKIQKTNERKTPPPTQRQKVDLSNITSRLDNITIGNISASAFNAMSQGEQDAISSYIASFRERIRVSVKRHPVGANPLRLVVKCDISGGGIVSNARIVESSGDSVYDSKVLDAFKANRYVDPPPGNSGFQGISFTIMQDG